MINKLFALFIVCAGVLYHLLSDLSEQILYSSPHIGFKVKNTSNKPIKILRTSTGFEKVTRYVRDYNLYHEDTWIPLAIEMISAEWTPYFTVQPEDFFILLPNEEVKSLIDLSLQNLTQKGQYRIEKYFGLGEPQEYDLEKMEEFTPTYISDANILSCELTLLDPTRDNLKDYLHPKLRVARSWDELNTIPEVIFHQRLSLSFELQHGRIWIADQLEHDHYADCLRYTFGDCLRHKMYVIKRFLNLYLDKSSTL